MTAHTQPTSEPDETAIEVTRRDINTRTAYATKTLLYGQVHQDYPIRLRCECTDPGCDDLIEVLFETALEPRKNDRRFFLAAGHENIGAEKVVEHHKTYIVVEKKQEPATRKPSRSEVKLPDPKNIDKLGLGKDYLAYFSTLKPQLAGQ